MRNVAPPVQCIAVAARSVNYNRFPEEIEIIEVYTSVVCVSSMCVCESVCVSESSLCVWCVYECVLDGWVQLSHRVAPPLSSHPPKTGRGSQPLAKLKNEIPF